MSEHEPETQEDAETPADAPLEDDDADLEEQEADNEEQPDEQPEPPEAEAPEGMTEKQLEASRKKLDAENARHRARISDLIGEEAVHLIPCELCNGFADGYRFDVQPPDFVVDAVRVAIGLPDLSNFQQAKHAHQCPDCAGLGVVLSGSQVPENAAITCLGCNGSGYQVAQTGTGELQAPTFGNGHATQELPPGINPDDPAVKELRARGFTVFPPVQIAQGS